MVGIVFHLFHAAAVRLVDGQLHGGGDGIGIHDDLAIDLTGSTTGRLRQTAMTAQEALLVGIEDGNERHFRQVEALAEQIDAHQHVVGAVAKVLQYLDTVQRGHLAMDVGGLYVVVEQVFAQLLGHALGQRGDQHALLFLDALGYLLHQVVYLVLCRPHLYLRV